MSFCLLGGVTGASDQYGAEVTTKATATNTPLKKEFALLQTLSRLFHFVQFITCWQLFLELIIKDYRNTGKENESRCLAFTSSTKREIRHCHVVVVQSWQRQAQKGVMHVHSSCFANLILLGRLFKRHLTCGLFTWRWGTPGR